MREKRRVLQSSEFTNHRIRSMDVDDTNEVEKFIQLLSEGDTRDKNSVDEAVAKVERLATTQGLDSDQLSSLMEFILGKSVANVQTRCRLVRCLIPSHDVPHSAVLHSLGCLGQLPPSLKQLLFKWIVLIFDIIDNKAPLGHVYDLIFHYVQYDSLRPIVCQLLCYLTSRKDVKPYRVHRLLQIKGRVLLSQDSADSALLALLAIYKQLCPHLVSVPVTTRQKVWFRPFEKQLAKNITKVQGQRSSEGGRVGSGSSLERLRHCMESIPPPAKRAKKHATILGSGSVIAPPSSGLVSSNSLSSVQDLCENIDRLELPQQMASILESSLLQHVFHLWSERSASLRFISWLQHALGNELDTYVPGAPEVPYFSNLLKCLYNLTSFLLEPIPTVEHFLSLLLETWNGDDYQSEVLGLLTYLSLQLFEDLEEYYLMPLKQLYFEKDFRFRYLVITTLTSLLRNFAVLEWPRLDKEKEITSLFPMEEDALLDFDPVHTIQQFIKFTEDMLCYATVENKPHPLLQHAAANFYELVTRLPKDYGVPILCIPRPHLVFMSFLSLDAAAISRTLACFVNCKDTLSTLKRSERNFDETLTFNSLVLDLCNALWRNLAFANTSRPYPSILFQLPSDVLEENCLHDNHKKLSLVNHPALLGHVWDFLKQQTSVSLSDSSTQHKSISDRSELRMEYLDYLEQRRLQGVVSFIRTFLKPV